jgi:adenylate kinase
LLYKKNIVKRIAQKNNPGGYLMNILIFGPNGSGKGTQGAVVQKKFNITHVESGALFRENIKGGTELGKKAKEYIDRGDLVPDSITIPMILDRLKKDDCKNGWLLDGFPRNPEQAVALEKALEEAGIVLDYIIELSLDRETARKRIMGRRLCENDNNHPNNIYIDEIKPAEKNGELVCRVCGGKLSTRADDQDEAAINKRHDIYYDSVNGTMAAVNYFKRIAAQKGMKFIELDGTPSVKSVTENMEKALQ